MSSPTPEAVLQRIATALPEARVELIANPSPSGQHSLLIDGVDAVVIARFLRDDPELQLDYLSNVSGVDWPPRQEKTAKKPAAPAGEETLEPPLIPGFLEVVYHLYSITKKHGPIVLRMRTADRDENVTLPSLTPVYKSADLQEREVYDLYGVVFEGHPDLRRLLMWDEFEDHPMRKDYVAPDDFEYEPTPHGEVLQLARGHYPASPDASTPNE